MWSNDIVNPLKKTRKPSQGQLINIKDILRRIKELLGIRTDIELAVVMAVDYRRIQNWKLRNTVPTDIIIALCSSKGLGLEYILTGNKAHMGRYQYGNCGLAYLFNRQSPLIAHNRVRPPNKKFVKYDSHGNLECSFESPQIVDMLSPETNWLIHSLGVKPKDFMLMRIVDDSMFPWVQDGDLVFVDTSQKNTFNGGVLALRYSDGIMLLRRIYRNPDGTLLAKTDTDCCEPVVLDTTNKDMEPLVVGTVVRRIVKC
jgi:hypothetical protein